MFASFALGIIASILLLVAGFLFISSALTTPMRFERKKGQLRQLIGEIIADWWMFATTFVAAILLYAATYRAIVSEHPIIHLVGFLPVAYMLLINALCLYENGRINFRSIFTVGAILIDASLMAIALYGALWGLAGWTLASLATASELWRTLGALGGIAVGIWLINRPPRPTPTD